MEDLRLYKFKLGIKFGAFSHVSIRLAGYNMS